MNHYVLSFFLITLICGNSYSQILKGKVTDESGDPIPYSTVFIRELKQGTTTNTKGEYELKLPAGKYVVTYQSLGFSPVFYDITLADGTVTKNVILPLQYYEIPEVRISASGEDPAYNIMRKAIGMAPYYLNYINSYKAEVYLKGNLVFRKIPRLIQRSIRMESDGDASAAGAGIKEGYIYMMESFNEIEFTAPDKYVQRVISVNSTFPEQGDNVSPMDIVKASFYQPVIADIAISPLSPQAFSYYKFKYLGANLQGNNIVNKIQVIPRIKSQQLFEGIIYIIEDLWCLHSIDLINNNIAGKISIEQLYIPVENDIWMPVSLKFEIDLGILGLRADAGYGTSVRYTEVKPNTLLKKPGTSENKQPVTITATTSAPDKVISKNQEKVEKILEKENLSNRDMIAMARLMKKESGKSIPDTAKNELEIKDNTTRIVEKDASLKDSAYWAAIRPIPLSDPEIRSIKIRDSIKNELPSVKEWNDTIPSGRKKEKNRLARGIREITTGHSWSDTTGLRFTFSGLVDPENIRFNSVDGFVYGLDFRFSGRINDINSFYFAPEADYAFSRERLMWRINGGYSFSRKHPATIFFRTGVMSMDISTGGSINTFLNSLTSLLLKENHLKLYEGRYFTTGFRGEVSKRIRLEVSAGYENRKVLDNNTGFSFFRRQEEYTDNIPGSKYLAEGANPFYALRDHVHFEFTTNLTFTPGQRYRVNNGIRISPGYGLPLFSVLWKHGINEFFAPDKRYRHYDLIRLETSEKYIPGAFTEFVWKIRTGGILNKQYLPFFDFSHFNVQTFPFLLNDYQDAFYLPEYYSLSTPEFFGEIHLKYTTPYLLLKYLPGISNTLIRENLSISWLGSLNNSVYTEFGYSLSELLLLGEAGIFAGFDNLKYRCLGFKLILKFN